MGNKKQIIKYFLEQDFLLSEDVITSISEDLDPNKLILLINEKIKSKNFLIIDNEIKRLLTDKNFLDFNWNEFEKARVLLEKNIDKELYKQFIHLVKEEKAEQPIIETFLNQRKIKILENYVDKPCKREIQNFIDYFNARFKYMERFLVNRPELTSLISINRLKNKKEKEHCSIIGLVSKKFITKNNNILLTLEDSTGQITVLVNKNKPELFELAKDLTLDEIIGVNGASSESLFFANNILLPEVPLTHSLKKCSDEVYAICLSDLHVGSTEFLPDSFNRFLKWIRGEVGNQTQRDIANKTKYIFIVGDLVDGVGIYPGQENELLIKDIKGQYDACADYLRQIPEDKTIIICPGNHDAVRISEPQTKIYEDFAAELYKIKNLIFVSNPSLINIHADENFSGFDVLLYHGYSFDYFVANIDSIRNSGGYDRADLIMKFLLRRRHLSPSHTATLYIPDQDQDPLIIKTIPDFFLTGHIHKTSVSNYKNITMICGSCWQAKTAFQEKVGHHPEPSKVPIINLKTRNVKVLKF